MEAASSAIEASLTPLTVRGLNGEGSIRPCATRMRVSGKLTGAAGFASWKRFLAAALTAALAAAFLIFLGIG